MRKGKVGVTKMAAEKRDGELERYRTSTAFRRCRPGWGAAGNKLCLGPSEAGPGRGRAVSGVSAA